MLFLRDLGRTSAVWRQFDVRVHVDFTRGNGVFCGIRVVHKLCAFISCSIDRHVANVFFPGEHELLAAYWKLGELIELHVHLFRIDPQ